VNGYIYLAFSYKKSPPGLVGILFLYQRYPFIFFYNYVDICLKPYKFIIMRFKVFYTIFMVMVD